MNVGGSASGQQLTPSVYGTSCNVQWNLEGGNITDMSSNSSPSYFNFDSFQEIQVVTGGGDVSVQSSGLFINLVTKSGSNVFKGTGTLTFENDAMQAQNVTEELFNAGGSNGTGLSGNPLHRVGNYSGEAGGPIEESPLVLGLHRPPGHQRRHHQLLRLARTRLRAAAEHLRPAQPVQRLSEERPDDHPRLQRQVNYQLNSANKFQFLYSDDNKVRNARGASPTTAVEATTQQYSKGGEFANPTYS